MPDKSKTYEIIVTGIVQGVGFRPFIWRLANDLKLKGSVSNTTEGVLIKVNVDYKKQLLEFIDLIKKKKPAPAIIEEVSYHKIGNMTFEDFIITASLKTREKFQLISPDIATCNKCIDDINDEINTRRFYYPFTNCTNCGPRFTIIKGMPYDRPNTTMNRFKMCPDCKKEYINPLDRRFHAQPNACNICGPALELIDLKGKTIDSINPVQKAASLIKKGKIIGIKSLGGFQIACDATDDSVVLELRKRKKRPAKPFALMFKNIEMIKKYLIISSIEEKSLKSSIAPVVLLKKKHFTYTDQNNLTLHLKPVTGNNVTDRIDKGFYEISYAVSYYNRYEGAFLPYTPLHHLLFKEIDFPLVMTSGNLSEEPIASKNVEATEKLSNICDYFLVHNRDIYSKYDDSVIRIFNRREMILRRARGYAPYPIKLDINTGNKAILAVGAQEKNTFCIIKNNYAIVSQHIGDLETLDSYNFFKNTLQNYMDLFGTRRFEIIAYDLHPEYISTKYALNHFRGSTKIAIQHHKAHIAGAIAENRLFEEKNVGQTHRKNGGNSYIIGFSWDGTGYGDDGNIWGSEIFLVDKLLEFKRIGHLREKFLPGGEVTIKKPYRMSLVYLFNRWSEKHFNKKITFQDFIFSNFPFYKSLINIDEIKIIINQISRTSFSPVTTSMGRFFDAVSSILDLIHIISYESEAAVKLEMAADAAAKASYDIRFLDSGEESRKTNILNIIKTGKVIIDDFYIFEQILQDITDKKPSSRIAAKFHNTLVKIILIISSCLRELVSADRVVLAGGVFQNNLLLRKSFDGLEKNSFKVYTKYKVPVNDGGISLGQAYIAAKAVLKS